MNGLLDNILNIVAIEPLNGARPLSQLNSFNSVSNSTKRIAPDRTSEVMKISRSREEDWIFIVIISKQQTVRSESGVQEFCL